MSTSSKAEQHTASMVPEPQTTTMTTVDEKSDSSNEQNDDKQYISGWRLFFATIGIGLGLFLINFEVTIVSTALVPITNDLQDFKQASWVVTSYLLTYTAGLAIWAKLSDIFGRRAAWLLSMFTFVVFSAGCGAAQTLIQLIICRTFQGIGGSGIYAVGIAMVYEIVPTHKFPVYSSIVMVLFLLALVLGPILGGIISEKTSWRWVFLINVPFGAIAAVIILLAMPRDFPYQGRSRPHPKPGLKSVDFLGSALMVAALVLLITGLQQGSALLSWSQPSVIGPLCASVVAWAAFIASQWYSSRSDSQIQPVFPWRFCRSRLVMGLLLNAFMIGGVGITCTIQLPFRSQTAVGTSPLDSGVRLLAFSMMAPFGFIAMSMAVKNRRIPPIYPMLAAQLVQIVGLVFMSRGSVDDPDSRVLYGTSALVGLGMGACNSAATLMTPFIVEERDIAVGSASVVQWRFLGSTVVLAIITSVGNSWIQNSLTQVLGNENVEALFQSTESIGKLPPGVESIVRGKFVLGFNLQMQIVLGFGVASFFTTLLLWKRPQIRVP